MSLKLGEKTDLYKLGGNEDANGLFRALEPSLGYYLYQELESLFEEVVDPSLHLALDP